MGVTVAGAGGDHNAPPARLGNGVCLPLAPNAAVAGLAQWGPGDEVPRSSEEVP
jgi:hypothetical protein